MSLRCKSALLLVLALGVGSTALAQVTLQSAEGIRYASGGIGEGERDELILVLPDYNLKLVAAAKGTGAFLADVKLIALDARGTKVLETTLDGPWFVARFPPGRYELQLAHGSTTQKRTVTIPAQGRRVEYVYWADAGATTLKSLEQTEKPAPGAPK